MQSHRAHHDEGWSDCRQWVMNAELSLCLICLAYTKISQAAVWLLKFHENRGRHVHSVKSVYSSKRSTQMSLVWAGQVSTTCLCSGQWMELHSDPCLYKDCFTLAIRTSSSIVAIKGNNFLPTNRWPVRISFPCPGSWVQRPTYPVSVSANNSLSQHYAHIYSVWGDKYGWLVVMVNFSWTQIRAALNWIMMLSKKSHRATCHQKPWDESHNTPEETITLYHSPTVYFSKL